jgi:hypothetical protein
MNSLLAAWRAWRPLAILSPSLTALVAACAGQVAPDSRPAPDPTDAATSTVPSFGDDGPTDPVPLTCTPCTASSDCGGPQFGCVVSMGAPFCAAGCSKDGFCEAAQTCTWVRDPVGQPWRACLAMTGDPCASGSSRPVRRPGR